MTTTTLVMALVITVLAVATAAHYTRPAGRRTAAERYARVVDLDLGPYRESVERRLATREVAGSLGGVVATWTTAVGLTAAGLPEAYAAPLTPVGFIVGSSVGYVVTAWRESGRPLRDGPRLARPTAPRHEDYVSRFERRGAWVAATGATVLAVALVLLDRLDALDLDLGTVPPGLAAVTAVLPWLALLVDHVVAGRLLDQPQVASSPHELAWDDALRARTLRDLVGAVVVVGVVLPIVLLAVVAEALPAGWPENPAVGVVLGLLAAVVAATFVAGLAFYVVEPRRHVRDRLWPERAPAGEGAR